MLLCSTFLQNPSAGPLTRRQSSVSVLLTPKGTKKCIASNHVTRRTEKDIHSSSTPKRCQRVLPVLPRNDFFHSQKVETPACFQMIIKICKPSWSVLVRTAVRCQIWTFTSTTMTERGILMNTLAHKKPFLAHLVPKGQQVIIKANNGNSRQPSKYFPCAVNAPFYIISHHTLVV